MGVWHLSGLGTRPGALTMPLTYVYLLLKAASKGDVRARRFFESSGEKKQERKGAPQALVIFTSEEVITGKLQDDIQDKWFNTKRQSSAPKTIARYLSNLLNKLKDEDFSGFYDGWLDYIYFLKVDHEDFEDCFYKVSITLNALRDKEIWINMVGGSNLINAALLTAGSFSAVAVRYYYAFQSNISLLHPEIERPNFKNPINVVDNILDERWHELPIYHLDIGKIVEKLNQLFKYREEVNLKEVEKELKGLGYPKGYIAKIRGRLITIDGDSVSKGYMLTHLAELQQKAKKESERCNNFSHWRRWAVEKGILWELTLDGKCEHLKS